MKLYTLVLGLLLSVSMQAQAIPTLFFDGSVSYSSVDGMLTVDAVLTGSQDTSTGVPTGPGSSLSFQASFLGSTSDLFTTSGSFDTSSISIIGSDSTSLLTGDLMGLVMTGVHGLDFGTLTGEIATTGGSLFGDFGAGGEFLAFELNLTTLFDATMFDADFGAQLDGRVSAVQAVPEASSLALALIGMLGIIAMSRRKYFS